MPGTIVRTGNGVVNDTDKDSALKKKKKERKKISWAYAV